MRVRDLMTKDVATCRSNDMLSNAAQIMWDRDCGCVPVLDDEMHVVGMITDRDICIAAHSRNASPSTIPVFTAMSPALYGCGADDTLAIAEQIMREHQVRRLPVLDRDGRLQGILSLSDLARAATEKRGDKSPGISIAAIEATFAAVCKPRTTNTF